MGAVELSIAFVFASIFFIVVIYVFKGPCDGGFLGGRCERALGFGLFSNFRS